MAKKFITFLILCGLIIMLVFIGKNIANKGMDMISNVDSHDISTSMLLAQAKEKSLSEKAILNNDTSVYVGEAFKDSIIPEIQEFKEKNIIKQDDPNYDKYYVWSQETLDNLGVNVKLAESEYYIVNYESNDVITTKGVTDDGQIYYKLSDIKGIVVE